MRGASVGNPARATRSRSRSLTAASIIPKRQDRSAAMIIPKATASPCKYFSYPVAASMAWPKVWPKFKIARKLRSRSSRATTVALISQDRPMA